TSVKLNADEHRFLADNHRHIKGLIIVCTFSEASFPHVPRLLHAGTGSSGNPVVSIFWMPD
ncbi:MAG: hypothetical protein AAB089_07965, partial [Nitrospirota bacterium]